MKTKQKELEVGRMLKAEEESEKKTRDLWNRHAKGWKGYELIK